MTNAIQQWKKNRITILTGALAALGYLAAGCGGNNPGGGAPSPGGPGGVGQITFTVVRPEPTRKVPDAARYIKIDIINAIGSGPQNGQPVTFTMTQNGNPAPGNLLDLGGPPAAATVTGVATVPTGTFIIRATAYPDNTGTSVAQATKQTDVAVTVTAANDQNNPVNVPLTLESTIAQLVVSGGARLTGAGTAADPYKLLLPTETLPGDPDTEALTVTPRDAAGNNILIADGRLDWTIPPPSPAGKVGLSAPTGRTVTVEGLKSTFTGRSSTDAVVRITETESSPALRKSIDVNVSVYPVVKFNPVSQTVFQGASRSITATVPDGNAATPLLDFTVTQSAGAPAPSPSSASGTNVFTFNAPITNLATDATYTVTAVNQEGPVDKSLASIIFTVPALTVTVSPSTQSVTAGGPPQPFTAVVNNIDPGVANNQNVTWSLDAGSVGSIDPSTGVYTPPPAGSGSATVRATSQVSPSRSGTAAVTVMP